MIESFKHRLSNLLTLKEKKLISSNILILSNNLSLIMIPILVNHSLSLIVFYRIMMIRIIIPSVTLSFINLVMWSILISMNWMFLWIIWIVPWLILYYSPYTIMRQMYSLVLHIRIDYWMVVWLQDNLWFVILLRKLQCQKVSWMYWIMFLCISKRWIENWK